MEIKIVTADLSTVNEAAAVIGVARLTIYRWMKAGRILFVKLGGTVYIPNSEVDRMVADRQKNVG